MFEKFGEQFWLNHESDTPGSSDDSLRNTALMQLAGVRHHPLMRFEVEIFRGFLKRLGLERGLGLLSEIRAIRETLDEPFIADANEIARLVRDDVEGNDLMGMRWQRPHRFFAPRGANARTEITIGRRLWR